MTNFRPSMYLWLYIYIVYEWCRNLTSIRYDTHNLNQNKYTTAMRTANICIYAHVWTEITWQSDLCSMRLNTWQLKERPLKELSLTYYMAHTECPVDGIQRSTHVWQYNSNSINICVIRELMYDQECGSHAHTPTHTHTRKQTRSHKSNRYLAQIMNEPPE